MTLKYYNNLAYEEIGESNNEIILFLHSKIVSNWIWIKQKENYESFFKNYHCVFIDIPHHGKSQFNGEFTIEESSDMIIDFITNLIHKKNDEKDNENIINNNGLEDLEKINSINMVALGLGGSIAIEILNKKPQLINHLILSGLEIAEKRENENESIIDRLPLTKAEYLNEKPDRFIVSAYLRYYGIRKDYYDYLEKDLDLPIKKEKEIAFESFNYTISKSFKENKEIVEKENVLLIYGNKEDLNATYSAIVLKNVLRNARLIEINKGNHLWNIIDNELFNQIIISFIEKETICDNERVKIIE